MSVRIEATRVPISGRASIFVFVLLLIGVGAIVLSLMNGTPRLTPTELWNILVHGEGERIAQITVMQLRLPRVCLGLLAGAMLAVSGTLLQGAMNNLLAGPELVGVSAGAAVVMAAIIVLELPIIFGLHPWFALLGGLAGGCVVLLAAQQSRNPVKVVLIGAAISALLNAIVICIISLGTKNSINLLFLFLVGSLANRTWEHVHIILPWAIVALPLSLACMRPLNLLQLGDEMAEGLGLPVMAARLVIMMLAAAMVAAIVSVCGPIGWIALLAPHLVRSILDTSDARLVLPLAALAGSTLLLTADLVGRLLFFPVELPVGVWTTLIGGPVLLILFNRQLPSSAKS